MQKLEARPTWKLVPLSHARQRVRFHDASLIASLWVLLEKMAADESLLRYRARRVANGKQQRRNSDVDLYAPTVRMRTTQIMIFVAAAEGLVDFHGDFEQAFLHGIDLQSEVYMFPAPGYESYSPSGELMVYQLIKTIYGLLEGAINWSTRAVDELTRFGLKQTISDPQLFIRRWDDGSKMLLALYVDDTPGFATAQSHVDELTTFMKSRGLIYNIERLTWYQGIQIQRNPALGLIHMNQGQYVQKLVRKWDMQDAPPRTLPLPPKVKLLQMCEDGTPMTTKKPMKSVTAGINWVSTRPEIDFTTHNLARCMDKATVEVFEIAKDVLPYLNSSPFNGIAYYDVPGWTNILVAYKDSNHASDLPEDPHSTGSYYIFLNGGVVSSRSKTLEKVSTSTTAAEYEQLYHCTEEVTYIRQLLGEIGVHLHAPTIIYEDNLAAVSLANNASKIHARTRSMALQLHKIRERIADGIVAVLPVGTNDNIADVGTKALPRPAFKVHSKCLSMPFIAP